MNLIKLLFVVRDANISEYSFEDTREHIGSSESKSEVLMDNDKRVSGEK